MRKAIGLLLIFLFLLALPIVLRQLRFYTIGSPDPQEPPIYNPDDVSELVPTPETSSFEDDPGDGGGDVLLDLAHNNNFEINEISDLDGRVAARGGELVPFSEGDLGSALRSVNSYVVIVPMLDFSKDEVQDISEFVDRGGRLMLVGDPSRFVVLEDEEDFFTFEIDSDELPLNSVANAFDIVFNGDYLYNTVENEGNFRNIIVKMREGGKSSLMKGVNQVAFYGAHSVSTGSEGQSLLEADDNTWSSATDRPGGLALAVLNGDGQVLALGDLDFLDEPYSSVFDNGRFIAHIADFLMDVDREYSLADFPYFLGASLELVYVGDPELGADAFDEIIALQDAFRRLDRDLHLSAETSGLNDSLILGLYNQAGELAEILESEGITLLIDPPIEDPKDLETEEIDDDDDEADEGSEQDETEPDDQEEEEAEEPEMVRTIVSDLGTIQMSGTALILLVSDGSQQSTIVLASSNDGLENTISRLINLMPADSNGALSDCLLQGDLALCPTGVDDEPVEFKLVTGGVPEVDQESEEIDLVEEEEPDAADSTEGDLDADLQGEIELDTSVDAVLEEGQAHAWIFSQGPALLNIIVQSDDDMDGVLELYDPDGELLSASDSTFSAGEEHLDLAVIAGEGDYTIVIRDFFEDGGSYTLEVQTVSPLDLEFLLQGELDFGEAADGLVEEFEVHGWTITIDEPTTINLGLEVSSGLDALLAVFDPENQLLSVADSGAQGEPEIIEEISLENSGTYLVFITGTKSSGDYTLLVQQN